MKAAIKEESVIICSKRRECSVALKRQMWFYSSRLDTDERESYLYSIYEYKKKKGKLNRTFNS